jgi:hypothetical protein
MEITNLTYQGPPIDDRTTLEKLPNDHRDLLEQINGFIQFGGGIHFRGACTQPEWHSIATVWSGRFALSSLYPVIEIDDIPFGQDAFGDQFILRTGVVYRLSSETGTLASLNCGLFAFIEAVQVNPVEYLGLQPLVKYYKEDGKFEPGQLLNVYPPFCTKEAAEGVSLKAVSFDEQIKFLADFAAKIAHIPDGGQVEIKVK